MQSYDFIEKFWRHKWYKLLLWKKFWVGNDSSEAPKRSKNGSNFRLTWSIIFEKMKKFSFSCNKNGLVCQGMFWLLPIKSPDHIEPKTYLHHGHMKLRSLWIWIWSHLLWLQKKLFFEGSRDSKNDDEFWKFWNPIFSFKLFYKVFGVSWDTLTPFVAKLWLHREVLKT